MLLARDVMHKDVITVDPEMPLVEFERLLLRERIGGAPVMKAGELLGIASRSDIVRVLSIEQSMAEAEHSAFARQAHDSQRRGVEAIGEQIGERMQKLRVKDAMTALRAHVAPDAPLRDVAALLVKHRIHRVLVTEGSKLIGVISRFDLVELIADGLLVEP